MKTANAEIKIDPDFKRLLPQPSEEEKKLLREQLRENGCLEPLLVWKEEKVLVDGHNRYELCLELGIEFTIVEKSFPDRAAVELFIIENQLARRNASSRQQSYYRGFYYATKKNRHGGNRKEKSSSENQNLKKKTREIVAGRFGVAPSTVSEDAIFFEAVNVIAQDTGANHRNQLIESENLSKNLLQRLADLFKEENKKISSQEERQELVEAILKSSSKGEANEKIIEFEKQIEFALGQAGETLQEQGVDISPENLFPTREKTQAKSEARSRQPEESKSPSAKQQKESETNSSQPVDAVRQQTRHQGEELRRNDYHTPEYIIEKVRTVFGEIHCDPASSPQGNKRIKAKTFFTLEDNGLEQKWKGNIFLNPPGGKSDNNEGAQQQWLGELLDRYDSGEIDRAIFLSFNPETFWRVAEVWKYPICLPATRINFDLWNPELEQFDSTRGASYANVILLLPSKDNPSPDIERFTNSFQDLGVILKGADIILNSRYSHKRHRFS